MILCIVQRKGRDRFCSTLLSLCCSFICNGKHAQKRDWARAEDLDQWCCCTVTANAMDSWPQEHSSLPNEKPGDAFGLRDCWETWITALLAVEIIVSSTTAVGSANNSDWAAPGVGGCRLTTSCRCRATLEANKEDFHSLESVVALESCST